MSYLRETHLQIRFWGLTLWLTCSFRLRFLNPSLYIFPTMCAGKYNTKPTYQPQKIGYAGVVHQDMN